MKKYRRSSPNIQEHIEIVLDVDTKVLHLIGLALLMHLSRVTKIVIYGKYTMFKPIVVA